MPLSYQSITNPSSTSFTVSFEFLNLADIKAVGKLNSASEWTELPVTDAATSNGVTTVTVADAGTYSSAGEVRIYRASSQAALVDFQNGSRLSESDLDTAYRQGLFAAQEVRENAGENITTVGPQGPAGADGADGAAGADGQDGADGADGTSASNSPVFAAEKGSYQTSVTDNTYTKVTYTTETSDVDGCFSSSTFTAPSSGLYYFYANVTLMGDGSTSSYHYVTLFYKNGSALDAHRSVYMDDNVESQMAQIPIMGIIPLAQNDTVEVYAKCNTAAGVVQFKDGAFGGFKLA